MLKWANIFLFQWFFIRIVTTERKIFNEFKLKEISLLPAGNIGMGGTGKPIIKRQYRIIGFILPFTGLVKGDYKYVSKNMLCKSILKERTIWPV